MKQVLEAGSPSPSLSTLPKTSAGARAGGSDSFFATFLLFAADRAAGL